MSDVWDEIQQDYDKGIKEYEDLIYKNKYEEIKSILEVIYKDGYNKGYVDGYNDRINNKDKKE